MAEPAGGPPCAAAVAEVFTDRRVARLVANASGGAAGLHPSEQIGFALLQHHELLVNTLQLCERRALMRGNRLMQHDDWRAIDMNPWSVAAGVEARHTMAGAVRRSQSSSAVAMRCGGGCQNLQDSRVHLLLSDSLQMVTLPSTTRL
eukprot:CAMPEP_0183350272 /NCGR_PEP_ID=MMETSP0164_2-20130417/18403_1 /TAXON_ID=221442 /ORGANISM="Coccolithus pelagicus ssp braarudi, Strain PLY182g" /LENGTH=146 /DNA_ID=CAMNT_0025522169 /DNA_START=431 /DNA_END=872 /DNA_ORIENTATION=-